MHVTRLQKLVKKSSKLKLNNLMTDLILKNMKIKYYTPRKTGEEMLALKEELFADKKRILAAYPNLERDYAQRIAYSKYSKENNLRMLIPSNINDVNRIPKIIDKLPKNKDTALYREYIYDTNGNIIITNYVDKEKFKNETYYIVDFDGYRYLINNPSELTDDDIVIRLKFEKGKIVSNEEYRNGVYYVEFYYTVNGRYCCTTELMQYQYENNSELLQNLANDLTLMLNKHKSDSDRIKELVEQPFLRVIESIKDDDLEFNRNIKLYVTDKRSPVVLNVYELTYDESDKLKQVDLINMTKDTKKTIYPRPTTKTSGLLMTIQSKKCLVDRLTANGYTKTNGIDFATFWKVFKEFALNDKFNCTDDSILWEPESASNCSIHLVRQFVRESANGEYLGMEQLNIEFEIPNVEISAELTPIWSGMDIDDFFDEVEQSAEFKSIDPNFVVTLNIFFDTV